MMRLVIMFVVFIVLCAAVSSSFASDSSTPPFQLNARSAVVVDISSGEIVASKNEDDVRPIASITKLMTAMVTIDAGLPMDEQITITNDDVKHTMLRGRPYSTSLPVGTILTRKELLHLTLMNSQNRAAAALGRTYPGGMEAFVHSMNTKATAIGMLNTTFVEPTGLMSTNVSTARDLAVMVKHAASYGVIQELSTSTKLETHVNNRVATFGTTNRLLKSPLWDIQLQKTGYISSAGKCLVMLTQVADSRFVVVLLNTQSAYNRASDAIKIKHWIETGDVISTKDVRSLNPYKVQASKRTIKKKKHKKYKKVHRR